MKRLLLLIVLAIPLQATVVLLQHNHTTSIAGGGSATVAPSGATSAGSTMILYAEVQHTSSNPTVSSVSNVGSCTWAKATSFTFNSGANADLEIWKGVSCSGAATDTVTVNFSGTQNYNFLSISEFVSSKGSLVLHTFTAGTSGSSASATTGSFAITSGDLVFGAVLFGSGSTTAGAGFTAIDTDSFNLSEFQIVSASTATATATGVSSSWGIIAASFTEVATTPPASIEILTGGSFAPSMSVNLSGSPWSAMGSQSLRCEWRVDYLSGISNANFNTAGCAGLVPTVNLGVSFGTQNGIPDTLTGGVHSMSINTPGASSATGAVFTIRAQRDLAGVNCGGGQNYTYEVRQIEPSYMYWGPVCVAITSVATAYTSVSNYFDGGATGNTTAWLEGYNNVVKTGQGVIYCTSSPGTSVPCEPDISDSTPGQLFSYPFQGNMVDASGNGWNMGLGSATVSYSTTPVFSPLCSAGNFQVFTAGQPATLTNSLGLPLDGVSQTATLAWTKIAGPSVTITGPTTLNPTLSAIQSTMTLAAGTTLPTSYVFQLAVTDSTPTTSTCSIKEGSVSVKNGLVQTGNPTLDAMLHPQTPWGTAFVPWLDTQQKAYVDGLLSNGYNMGGPTPCTTQVEATCKWQTYWLNFQAGTISLPNLSSTVTGTGTNFTSVFGVSAGNPPPAGSVITVEYSGNGGNGNGTSTGLGPSFTRHAVFPVNLVTDSTHLAINTSERGGGSNVGWQNWQGTPTGRWAVDVGGNSFNAWAFGSAPGNFYNSFDLAPLNLYLRTGVDDYGNAGINNAKVWLQNPYNDYWATFAGYNANGGQPTRPLGQGFNTAGEWSEYSGFVVAILEGDLPCTDSGCTTGTGLFPQFRNLYDFSIHQKFSNDYTGFFGDRIDGHILPIISFCAHYDPTWTDSNRGLTCKQWLDGAFSNSSYAADPTTGLLRSGNGGYNTNNYAQSTTNVLSSYALNSILVNVTAATNAAPIVLTVSSASALSNGDSIDVSGVGGNTAANGTWPITVSGTSVTLVGSTGNGSYTSGGIIHREWCVGGDCTGTTVTLTHNSTAGVCVDGSGGAGNTGKCNGSPGTWGNGTFLWVQNLAYTPSIPGTFTFPGSTTIPTPQSPYQIGSAASYANGDTGNYVIASFADQHHFTLASNYLGISGSHLYQLVYGTGGATGLNGFYTQPYMAGIVGDGLWKVYQDLISAGDTATAATVSGFLTAQSTGLLNYVIDPAWNGPTYFVNTLNCYPYVGSFPHDGNCNANQSTAYDTRIYYPETSMGILAYILSQGGKVASSYQKWLIAALNGAWAKPGTSGGDPRWSTDNFYLNCLDTGGVCIINPSNNWWKWGGQFFGSSTGPSALGVLQMMQNATSGASFTGAYTGTIK